MNPVLDTSWAENAACKDIPKNVFFSEETMDQAKAICTRCPVKTECLEYAIATGVTDGVWGGLSKSQRHKASNRVRQNIRIICPICRKHFMPKFSTSRICSSEECIRIEATRKRLERRQITGRSS